MSPRVGMIWRRHISADLNFSSNTQRFHCYTENVVIDFVEKLDGYFEVTGWKLFEHLRFSKRVIRHSNQAWSWANFSKILRSTCHFFDENFKKRIRFRIAQYIAPIDIGEENYFFKLIFFQIITKNSKWNLKLKKTLILSSKYLKVSHFSTWNFSSQLKSET